MAELNEEQAANMELLKGCAALVVNKTIESYYLSGMDYRVSLGRAATGADLLMCPLNTPRWRKAWQEGFMDADTVINSAT